MEEEQEQVSDQSNLYSLLEVVWHLCEILFIEVLPAGCLIQQLLEWVRWHSTHTDGMIQVHTHTHTDGMIQVHTHTLTA